MRQHVQYKVPETETAKWNLAIFNVRAVARHRLALVWVISVIIYTCAFPILWHIVSVFPRPAHLWLISLSDLPRVSSAEPRYKPFFLSDHLSFPSSFVLFCLFLFVSRWYFLTTCEFLWAFCSLQVYSEVFVTSNCIPQSPAWCLQNWVQKNDDMLFSLLRRFFLFLLLFFFFVHKCGWHEMQFCFHKAAMWFHQ